MEVVQYNGRLHQYMWGITSALQVDNINTEGVFSTVD